MLIDLSFLYDISLLGLRILVAVIFFASGFKHAKDPEARGKSIGFSPPLALFLGIAEMVGALSVAFGIFIQAGAAILIVVMVGAIYKKIVEWDTGFFSDEGFGWHYDALLLFANMLFLASAGRFVLVG